MSDAETGPESRSQTELQADLHAELGRRTRRSLLTGAAATAAAGIAYGLWDRRPRIGLTHQPQRAAEELNRAIAEHVIGETALTPTYPAARATKRPFANGYFGLRKDLDPTSWRLQLTGLDQVHSHPQYHPGWVQNVAAWEYRYHPSFAARAAQIDALYDVLPKDSGGGMMTEDNVKTDPASKKANLKPEAPPPRRNLPGLLLTMDDIRALPFVEQTTEFKCIEGWSEIVTYGGVRFRDFLEAFPPQRNPDGSLPGYAQIGTPDNSYYCGFEIASLIHPQTLLCFQMSQRDLGPAHGAPLRLAMPLKYGYKQIKQIASIHYTDTRPDDYWGNRGYDWHAGI